MEGVAIDMLATFVLLWIGLTIIGLDYAIFFAVLSALLVVVPYFGAIAGAVPPVLFALTDSPGKALLALVVYIAVQQFESNITIPLVMSQRVRMHPAMVAIGVVVVGQLFGFVGLFVAVPILSLIVITTEEFWVKPIEESDAASAGSSGHRAAGLEASSGELRDRDHIPITVKITIRTWTTIQKRGSSTDKRLLDDRLTQRDRNRVHARVGLELQDRALGVRLDRLGR